MPRLVFFIFLLSLQTSSSFAYEKGLDPTRLINSVPARVIRLERQGRMPASVENDQKRKREENSELEKRLPVGGYALVKESTEEWNNQVVRITARYDDGSRQIQLDNGSYARVRFENLFTLSPETDKCCKSNGVNICKGDRVWHPLPSTSIGVPEGKVTRLFENCAAVVRDGLDYVYETRQLGKSVDCSPQKANVCVGKIVWAEGYRNGKRYQFEGPVSHVFTNGSVLVKTGLWLLPVDASILKVQTDSLKLLPNRSPASAIITSRDGQATIPVPTYPELEPFDAHDAQRLIDQRGLTLPIR